MGGGRRTMEWAARANHMGGIPRKMVILAVGAFAKAVASLLNSTTVHNANTLIHLVRSRPPGVPLLTVSNHMSTLDDPLMWGFRGFPTMDAKLTRWVLTAEDICFRNRVLSYVFRLGQCIPIIRGGGIYQEHMNEALDRLSEGAWVGMIIGVRFIGIAFALRTLNEIREGKISQSYAPIRRLKWGTASLIARASVTPIVLPIVHHGFQEVMPENYLFGRRPPFPLCNKNMKIIIGDPIEFDLPKLRETAVSMSSDLPLSSSGWPCNTCYGLNEAAQKCLYSNISKKIWTVMENLRRLLKQQL